MSKIEKIKDLLSGLNPLIIEVEDESGKHSKHYKGDEGSVYPSHIKISVVSSIFTGLSGIQRHKLVNKALEAAFQNGLHAASIKANSPEEI